MTIHATRCKLYGTALAIKTDGGVCVCPPGECLVYTGKAGAENLLAPDARERIKQQGCACDGGRFGQHVCPERYAEKYVAPEPEEFPDNALDSF